MFQLHIMKQFWKYNQIYSIVLVLTEEWTNRFGGGIFCQSESQTCEDR